jgi:hypothetical protein
MMLRTERFLMIALLAVAIPAFAQRGGHSGGMGAGGGMGSGAGMGADHSMGGSHETGSANAGPHGGSMASQSPDQVLSHNTAIASKIKTLTGQDASAACSGFKNLGQCVAAAHVSKNLGIPFADLRAKMTGSSPESLGKAIQTLKPSANSKTESKKANKQAEQDMNQSSS